MRDLGMYAPDSDAAILSWSRCEELLDLNFDVEAMMTRAKEKRHRVKRCESLLDEVEFMGSDFLGSEGGGFGRQASFLSLDEWSSPPDKRDNGG